MNSPRRCKIIKCGRLVEKAARVLADLAIADADFLTDAEADEAIAELETAAEKIEAATPSPPIT